MPKTGNTKVNPTAVRRVALELVKLAQGRSEIVYKDLADTVGLKHHRPLPMYLEEVVKICEQNSYPPLSVLVINRKTRKPGAGLFKVANNLPGYGRFTNGSNEQSWSLMRDAVWNVTDWSYLLEFLGDSHTKTEEDIVSNLDDDALRNQALNASPIPKHSKSKSEQYQRDPSVSAYAKRVAKGICQLCHEPAPFLDAHGGAYLEAHHIQWLSKGGLDSIFNVVALCPNCHKKMHILNNPKDVEHLSNIANSY